MPLHAQIVVILDFVSSAPLALGSSIDAKTDIRQNKRGDQQECDQVQRLRRIFRLAVPILFLLVDGTGRKKKNFRSRLKMRAPPKRVTENVH
jgi:hypothetical protein